MSHEIHCPICNRILAIYTEDYAVLNERCDCRTLPMTKEKAQRILAAVHTLGNKPMTDWQLKLFGYIEHEGGTFSLPDSILIAAGVIEA